MKIFLLILLLLFFFPFPISVSLHYSLNDYYLKIYKFYILKKDKKKKEHQEVTKKVTKPKKNKKRRYKYKVKVNYKKIIKSLNKNKFKPKLKVSGKISYSLNDPAHTAISYGIISAALPNIKRIIDIFFKGKQFFLPLEPALNKGFFLILEINSIFFLSLVQIIYMLFLILKGVTIKKERIQDE